MRYNLSDIITIIRKITAYILVGILIATLYVGIIALLTQVFKIEAIPYFFKPPAIPLWFHITLLTILVFVFHPLAPRVQRLIDRWFYRERYDYLKALQQFSKETQSIVDRQARLSSSWSAQRYKAPVVTCCYPAP